MAGAETDIVAVPAVIMVFVDMETFSPVGKVELTSVMGPVNPETAVTVRVEVQDEPPAFTETSDGLVETVKSGPFKRTGKATVALYEELNAVTTRS